MKSRFKVLNLIDDDKNNYLQYFEFTIITYYSLLRRRFNNEMKAKRKLTAENEA